ncbi:hypothetical protein RIF29_14234 [Crotalaria pallida]|uniref:Uncharacterized protein n=1 Tax=Crotalaria pallida TaxID=3830 RepID=A0AAN9FDH2_CROPI
MFPSPYRSSFPYPYPCFHSSYHPFAFPSPENATNSNNNTSFPHDPPLPVPHIPTHHHHHETLSNFAVAENCSAMFKNDVNGNTNSHFGLSNFLITKKPASKKDRHSKIHTSQGLRDRRVRLSIDIARKFFDLQDMLGFDKASDTLEWLFNKSKKAMKELARSKHSSYFNRSSSSSGCEEVVSMAKQDSTTDPEEVVVDSKEKKMKLTKLKESREKARARARERTSKKMCNMRDTKKKCPTTIENPQIFHQLRSSSPFHPDDEDLERSQNNKVVPSLLYHPHLVGNEADAGDDYNVIEESIVIKRKLKQSLMSSSNHQNLVIPKEASFNNTAEHHSFFPILSQNWDANGATATGRSNISAIAISKHESIYK